MPKGFGMASEGTQMASEKAFQKRHQKREPKKHMIFEKVPVGILFPPDLPKMITNQQDNLQKNNKKKTTYSR